MEQSVCVTAAATATQLDEQWQHPNRRVSRCAAPAQWSLLSLMALAFLGVSIASSLPGVSANALLAEEAEPSVPLPFLQTKPPHSFEELQPSLAQFSRQLQHKPKFSASGSGSTTRGNVRRRARGKEVNRALKHKTRKHQNHHHQNPKPEARDGHNEDKDASSTDTLEPEEEHTTVPGAETTTATNTDDHEHQDYNEAEHGDGLDHHHHEHSHEATATATANPYQARKGKSKSSKGSTKQSYKGETKAQTKGVLEEEYEDYEDAESYSVEYHYKSKGSKSKSKSSKSKDKSSKASKQGHRGKKGKRPGSSGELRYFEASVLLELQDHYVTTLSYLDLQQLETAVVETYNHLSESQCDLQARELVAATMDPTPTSTGYILHMQGQCYNCDPAHVRVFAHSDQVFDQGNSMMMSMGGGGSSEDMPPRPGFSMDSADDMATSRPTATGTGGGDADGGDTGTGGAMTAAPGTDDGTAATAAPNGGGMTTMDMMTDAGAGTGTGAGANGTAAGTTVPGAAATDAPAAGAGAGTNATTVAPTMSEPPPATDVAANGTDAAAGRNRGSNTPLLKKKHKTFSKQRSRLVRSQDEAPQDLADAEPEFSYGISAQSRAAYHENEQIRTRRRLNQHHQRNHHHHHATGTATAHGNQDALNREPELPMDMDTMEYAEEDRAGHYDYEDDPDVGLIMPYKQSRKSKSKGASYHPERDCTNEDATRRAPTEEQFVVALNDVTDELLAQYNKLSVRSAVQVQAEPCSAIEEEFESALVMQFLGPEGDSQSLTAEEIGIVEQTILHSYNHLQATHSCDIPYFREITGLMLRGIAQGPSADTFLAMFVVQGTCRGEGCSDGATFFDPRDEVERTRLLQGQPDGFDSFLTRDGHAVSYDEKEAHVYQEQCYCPFKVDEFGPPFVSDMQAVLDQILQDAFDDGVVASVVSVVDIMEVTDDDDDDVAFEHTSAPGGTGAFDSFVIVQFFGQRDLVTEREINEIEASMPLLYKNLQDNSFCDPLSRVLTSAQLRTVDPGPTADTFLLGFAWEGTCEGDACDSNEMFFSPSGQQFVSCGTDKVAGAPVIEDFENDLFQAILALRETGDLVSIQASGDAVEVLPGGTPAPILQGRAVNVPAQTPQVPKPTFAGRTSGQAPTDQKIQQPQPTEWPTYIDEGTWYPTFAP